MKTVYISFSSGFVHRGHINLIKKACQFGEVIAGVLTDEAIFTYDRAPIVPLEERIQIYENMKGISKVVVQDTVSYQKILQELRCDYVVHGDDWKTGPLAAIRKEVMEILQRQGGKLIEFPYTYDESIARLEERLQLQSGIPEIRRPKLRQMLMQFRRPLRILEAHSGLSGLIVEKTTIIKDGIPKMFDGIWISSLCDSTMKGKPDIELVDMTSRMQTVDEIMEVTTKPIVFDGDTGGQVEHFVHNIRTLERSGVSAVIIEDKMGLKKNSLFGNDVKQQQDTPEGFSMKIRAAKQVLNTREFMLIARIESLILEQGLEDALFRARKYVEAGADGIMIHSRKKEPDEIFAFCRRFREEDKKTVLVVVPTTFSQISEEVFGKYGVNLIIYANHLIRSAYPAMLKAAEQILQDGHSNQASQTCMPISEILHLIPD